MDRDDDIAIIGVGCMFPGARNLAEFWDVLSNGEDHVKEIPPERFSVDAFYDADPNAPGKSYVRKAGLLTGHNEWDNHYFGVSEYEALHMDPQQRYVLECVQMAMEDGGITRKEMDGSNTGVYIGAMNNDFRSYTDGDNTLVSNYTVTGISPSIISARVSYFYNLLGPSMTLDTACSSSLVAIHTAATAIKSGDIDMAVCGGVSSILNPEMFICLSKARMASQTGHCHAFSSMADGYARGEGCGIVILKRLKEATDDGNKIWATILTGCNQDGRTNAAMSAPSQSQQERLLESIYLKRGIDPRLVQYIEAHGTGTPVGDPVEANALGCFFRKYLNEKDSAIKIGSVKTNIGHLESAAGVAGLIKVLLMMRHNTIVKSLFSESLNPNIPFEKYKLEVVKSKCKWPNILNSQQLACVNCFGFGGTNTHAVLQKFSKTESLLKKSKCNDHGIFSKIITFSAESPDSLIKYIHRFRQFIEAESSSKHMSMQNLSYTTCTRRDHLRFRLMMCSNSVEELRSSLELVNTDNMDIHPISMGSPNIIFVYPGVGTAWKGMCKEFIETSLVFKDTLQEIDKYLLAFTGWSIIDKFISEEDVVDDPFVNHIAICSCQIALTNTWIHLGVKPLAVVGQSVGEVAAAYASGALSLQQTISVIYHRSKELQNCTGGAMAVVKNCNTSTVEEACKKIQSGKVNIAVYLSEVACTVSGDPQAVEELKAELNHNTKDALIFIDLKVKCAYHSHFTLKAGNELQQLIQNISSSKPKIPVFSSVTGIRAKVPYYASAEYWADNVRNPVYFSKAVSNASTETKAPIFLEISPRPVLQAHLQNIFPNSNGKESALASFRLKDERKTFLQTFSRLYETGVNFSWCNFMHSDAIYIDIPNYVYSKQTIYLESENRTLIKAGGEIFSNLRGLITAKPGKNNEFTLSLDEVNTPFVFEHIVGGVVLAPAALYGEIGLELGNLFFQGGTNEMEVSWRIENPCVVQKNEKQLVSVICSPRSDKTLTFKIISNVSDTIYADGRVSLRSPTRYAITDIHELRVMMSKEESCDIYTKLRNLGFEHGNTFQIVKTYKSNDDQAFAEIELTSALLKESNKTFFHPVIIDAMLQCCLPTGFNSLEHRNSILLPFKIGSLVLLQHPVRKMVCYSKSYNSKSNALVTNILLLRPDGAIIAEMRDFEIKIVNGPQDLTSLSYVLTWDRWRIKVPQQVRSSELFLVVFSRESVPQFKTAVQKLKMRIQLFEVSVDEEIPVILDKMKSRVAERSLLPTLVFIPGFTIDGQISEKDVYQFVKRTCNFLMKLVQVFCNVPIDAVCITERTQPMLICNSENTNILGSELWGMARSIVKEIQTFRLTMVDVSPSIDDTVAEIAQILACITNDPTTVPPEIKVTDSMFYYSKIKPLRSVEDDNQLRIQKLTRGDKVWIRSEERDCVQFAFGIPQEIESYSDNNCVVQCRSALICTKRNFFSNRKHENITDFWPPKMHMGYKVFACEISGYINDNMLPEKKCKREIISSCSPIELGTEISVPRDLFVFKSEIPEYSPGLLHKTILAMNITDIIRLRSQVSICHDKTYPGLLELVEILLQEKKCSVETVLHESDFGDFPLLKSTHVIIAVQQSMKTVDDYQNVFPNARYLISFKGCFPSVSIRDIQSKRGRYVNRIFLDPTDIFCTYKLRTCFTKVTTWLTKLSKGHMLPKCQYANDDEIYHLNELRDFQVRMPQDLFLRRNAAYVVVGGLTGLGWLIVKFLSSNGAKYIITLSRKKVDKEMTDRLTNIQRLHGVKICHYPVDICNRQLLTCTFEKIKQTLQNIEIKGIFHGAGVTEDVGVLNMTTEKLNIPLKPKVLGTWNLHLVSLGMNLDYFIMHSSIVSILGHEGQSNYGAANAFMDTLAAFRRRQSLPAQSINWGALEVGMTNDRIVKERLTVEGINNLTKQQIDGYSKEKHSRHTIIIDDMTYLHNIQYEGVQLTHLGANHDRSFETALSVFYNKNRSYLELRLGFKHGVVQEYLAETILEDMEELMNVFLTDRKLTLDMWIPKYDVTDNLSPIPEFLFKYNEKGGGHYVTFSLVSSGGETFLEWGKTNGRRLLLKDIHALKGRCIRGLLELVEILLQEKKCSVETVLHESDFGDFPLLKSTHVIIAVQQSMKTVDDYQNVFPNARYLISFKGCFPSVSIRDIQSKRGRYVNRIFLDPTDIFCTYKLRTCFTKVTTWLTKLSKGHMLPKCQYANDDEIYHLNELRDFQVRMPQDLFLRRNAAYVVVGGLTGLGWLIVKFLFSNGAKYIITLSRKKVDKEMTDRLTNIQRLHGVKICHYPVDICNRQLLTCTFEKIKQTLQNIEIKGIFHGAGVTEDVGVLNMTTEKLNIPLKPKVLGTWNLHLVSLGMNLDYFIMHSSIVSILGHEGQSNYGAANAFMDTLAAFRRRQSLPAQSINWGALEVGMTNDRIVKERLTVEGINNLTKQQICAGIFQCALSTLTQVCFADIHWDVLIPPSTYKNNHMMSKVSGVVSSKSRAKLQRRGKFRLDLERYNILTRDEQMQTMIDIVHIKFANLFALHKSEIDTTSMLVDYGLDSQKTTELINSLYQTTRVRIPFVQLISGESTIENLARFIVEQIQNDIESHGEDGFDEDMSFIAGSPSYMEKLYLDMLADDPYNPHLTITADYKISIKYRSSELWKAVLQTLISFNPELRTVFRVMDGEEKRWGLVKEVMDPEDTIVDFQVFDDKKEFQKALNTPNKHDPLRDLPMRALFYEGKKYALLRMVFSHCSFDLCSSLTIANNIRDIAMSLCQNERPSVNKKEVIDAAVIMEERFQPRLKTLETYWKSQLQLVSHKLTLKSDKGVSIRVTNSLYVSKIFEEQHVTRVQCYVQDVKQTLFNLICTIYQIVLHKHSNSNAISVISAVDLRNYDILEMRERVGLGVNFIPLIADLRNSHLSLEQIFLQNCQVIKQGITNSLFPYGMLKNIDGYSKEKHSRHTIIIDDMTYLHNIQYEGVQLTHLGANHDRSFETALSVFYNKNRSYLELRLGFKHGVVQEYLAETILEDMEELMNVFLTDRKLTLDMWIPKYDVTDNLSPIPEFLFKYNEKGGGHYVTFSLVSSGGETFLEWGKTNGRRLLLKDIHALKGRCIRGLPSIVLETNGIEHIFSSDNKRLIEAWIVKIWRTKKEMDWIEIKF